MEKVKLFIEGKGEVSVDKGSTLEKVAKLAYGEEYKKYLGARIDNEIFLLTDKIEEGKKIKFLDISDTDGHKIYIRTLSVIYIKACEELFPGCNVNIEHSLGEGLYTEIKKGKSINFKEINKIKEKMEKLIREDKPILREKIKREEAIKLFEEKGYIDKVNLYKHVDKEEIHIYRIDDHIDSFYGYLAPSTGYVQVFDLKYYYPGAILLPPSESNGFTVPEFIEQRQLAKVFKETEDWVDILDLGYLGTLNDTIVDGSVDEVIKVSEALHEKKIANIADKICEDDNINLILIAGPSSSGKTTFAHRLAVQLKVNGKRPISISVDDYFVNREDTPRNEFGEYDFEALEAIDVKLFNEDLIKLLEGEEVELPKFNFVKGVREPSGKIVKVDEEHPIIVEGIHCLNSKLTRDIPEKNKFKIYVSALTQLNVDAHNRIPTTDTRLIRRIVRDNKFRGNDVKRTFKLWELVRKGEEENIFPYQEEADIMFNSSLVYELSVLKKYVEPQLKTIDKNSEYYSEAKRLLKFLEYFKDIEDEFIIPPTSILREFIGGSCFK
ncbi:MAG: nucleoside kinase [Clostridiaceae bacterium]|nr:nucleoside kinase [Clostridiaceae bacterium]MBW4860726.1 nucleoside kinase [Clostridiaceae bacterium]MBW4869020.1 nucleoside kinase [Clostridiaceae bacterium]